MEKDTEYFKQVYSPSEEDTRIFKDGGQPAIDLFRSKVWLLIYERLMEILLTDDQSSVSSSYQFNTFLNSADDAIDFIGYYIESLLRNKVPNGELLNGYDPTWKNLIPLHTASRILKLRIINWAEENGKKKLVYISSSPDDEDGRGWHALDDYTSEDAALNRHRTIDEIQHSAHRAMQQKIILQYKSGQAITATMQTAAAQTYHALHTEQEGRIELEKNLQEDIELEPSIDQLMNKTESGQMDLRSEIDKKCKFIKDHPGTHDKERGYQVDQITELVIRSIYKPVKAIDYGFLFGITKEAAWKRMERYWENRKHLFIEIGE